MALNDYLEKFSYRKRQGFEGYLEYPKDAKALAMFYYLR